MLKHRSISIKFIVTGTGRCGTVYAARLLTQLGIPCGHESIFNQENESIVMDRFYGKRKPTISDCSKRYNLQTNIVADSSYMAVPYLEKITVPILHITRNPLAVISSFVKDLHYFTDMKNNPYNNGGWEDWIYQHVPDLKHIKNPIERACYYYVFWNQSIENTKNVRVFYNVEKEFNLFEFLKVKPQSVRLDKQSNSMKRRSDDFKTKDIPEGKIKTSFLKMMEKYGY